jgi:dihydroxyacetone kinase-like protein
MKKLINTLDSVLHDQLEGMALAHAGELRLSQDPTYLLRADAPLVGKVALISGGGSGHEPLHGGLVGLGMLTGACPGHIFTSPTPEQIHACARAAHGGAGVLLLIKNYTGDVLSFETAAEMLHADGIAVRTVLIDDDVAVKDSLFTAGRRGVGGTLIVERIAGAAAESGNTLAEVARIATEVSLNSRSMGMALSSCTVPAVGRPTFELHPEEMEIGIGIHGEPGQRRLPMTDARTITRLLVDEILEDGPYIRLHRQFQPEQGDWEDREQVSPPLRAGDSVIAMVNGMGGTPLSELYTVYAALAARCAERHLHIARCLVGSYVTSLEMQGCSITLTRVDPEHLALWDAPVRTPALRWGI